jgi:hypothetical protein
VPQSAQNGDPGSEAIALPPQSERPCA